jgi:peptidoglycan/LPS O-acetylase OafA/YrhL
MDYRKEIDGLRALAVIPVILFHAGFESFSGGFVGVDVFFVISGYLITSIILSELEKGKFSIINFYERRARRILPALFLVILVCIPFAWFLLLPSDMKDFSQSLVAVSVFASNILFWSESGYFDTSTELKPLLHTWSLAVEEQYYLVFPLFLMLFWRLGKRWIVILLAAVFVGSLAVAQWSSLANPSFAFYLLPSRGWEMLMGAFAAFYLSQANRKEFSKGISEIGGWLGVVLILYAVFAYSKATPFPGFYALIPTVGTALIILFSNQKTSVGRFVGNKAFVGIGLISYSAYLWHQPLFAFARHSSSAEPSHFVFGVLIVVTVILAFLSWRYVERPFRAKGKFSQKSVFIFAILGSAFLISFGLYGNATKGFESRFDDDQRRILSFNSYDIKEIYRQGECFLTPEQSFSEFKSICYLEGKEDSTLIWGDSHAAALSYGLRDKIQGINQYTSSGCPPLIGVSISWRPMCEGVNKFVAEQIIKHKPRTIFLHANWLLFNDNNLLPGLKNTFDFIQKNSPNTKIIVLGGVPQYSPSLPTYMVKQRQNLVDGARLYSLTSDQISKLDNQLASLSEKHGALFFSPLQTFCDKSICLVTARHNDILMPTAWDYGHLTSAGSIFLSEKFMSFYQTKR